ncbi:phage terminase large subunit family protein [Stieleria sp. ICT_E10.1]|uniref:phage terminase large subunit family protein n=1 Tax=Stieleria sedimenti TaxID=2976331 RepID=UPI0021807F14|nr:phage terminase large subunit family protein [Stieleria sedimenti]MCS7466723.1 phage terminase large subunit family protein [Stieleria sedimenti]
MALAATMGCVALSDYGTASGTILYVCEECGDDIREEQRREMIRKGVWCAEGQYVDSSGQLIGTPTNDGPDESFQLSRLYGPTFSFSDNVSVLSAQVSLRGPGCRRLLFTNPKIHRNGVANWPQWRCRRINIWGL